METGHAAPALQLEDQHGKPLGVAPDTRILLFSADRAANDLASEVLGKHAAGTLERRKVVYVADISGMPSLVTRMFALPAMRALPFPIGLAREAGPVADLPRQKGAVTVIQLNAGKVGAVDYASDSARLQQLLELD
ncbi:MAG: hypothetical protein F9K15_21820 [Zoogloea sp.]|nr:MAG: hypothetical protein F9K15_21820 [Zoogloea sp.]